jgi:N-acyl-D-amino-acid deacylase
MRGYGARIGAGMSEITELAEATGARQHVAHLRGSANDVEPLLDDCEKRGVDMTFDSYPYQAGSTLLSARVLAPELTVRGLSVALAWVHAADERELLALSGSSVGGALLASNAASSDELGVPLAEIARRRDLSLGGLLHALLIDSDLAVTVIVPASVSSEAESDYARLLAHSRQMACSDGIYVGDHPHPRGWGAFTRVLARHVVERGDLTIEQAAVHLSARAARVFGIPDRGVLEKGKAADIVVLDLPALRDTANLTSPRELATGVHSVYVNGHETWRDGTVTAPHSGRAIRRIRAQQ